MEGQCNNYFASNWDNTMDQSDPFESALSSIVSSPVASNAGVEGDNTMIRELIGRLGTICNSGQISPSLGGNSNNNSTNTTCSNTPLNSPPKLNLMDQQITGNLPLHPGFTPIATDPGFAERAARFSCFGSSSFSGLSGNLGLNMSELPLRPGPATRSSINLVSNSKSSRLSRPSTPENAEAGDSREGSSVSEQAPGGEMAAKGQNGVNSRKRKAVSKTKGLAKDAEAAAENNGPSEKKAKASDLSGTKKEAETVKTEQNENAKPSGDGNQKQNKDNSKPPEPPKDYIHVRARRGQATDSHSLAERVRREKISQRMKVLQDLVPGCNKVTGKAVMLDEIINYVQSLQRQVEFLSMKLATINPGMDINMEAFLSKDIFQASLPNSVFVSDPSLPFAYQQGLHLHNGISNNVETQFLIPSVNPELLRNPNMPFSHTTPGFIEASHQVSKFWEDDLQSVVQMGLAQNPEILNGSIASAQMKVEL